MIIADNPANITEKICFKKYSTKFKKKLKGKILKDIDTRELTKISMCVALCCVTAQIAFPLPFTPGMVTALTITMSLTAYILSPKKTFLVILIYILLGAAGLPVFAGGSGFGKLFGPSGGFYFAWLVAYPLLSLAKGSEINFRRYLLANIFVAMPVTYLGGLISMVLVLDVNFFQAMMMAVFPFVLGDILKAAAAAFLGKKLNSAQF